MSREPQKISYFLVESINKNHIDIFLSILSTSNYHFTKMIHLSVKFNDEESIFFVESIHDLFENVSQHFNLIKGSFDFIYDEERIMESANLKETTLIDSSVINITKSLRCLILDEADIDHVSMPEKTFYEFTPNEVLDFVASRSHVVLSVSLI